MCLIGFALTFIHIFNHIISHMGFTCDPWGWQVTLAISMDHICDTGHLHGSHVTLAISMDHMWHWPSPWITCDTGHLQLSMDHMWHWPSPWITCDTGHLHGSYVTLAISMDHLWHWPCPSPTLHGSHVTLAISMDHMWHWPSPWITCDTGQKTSRTIILNRCGWLQGKMDSACMFRLFTDISVDSENKVAWMITQLYEICRFSKTGVCHTADLLCIMVHLARL